MREILFKAKHVHALNVNKCLDKTWMHGFLVDENYINSPELEGEFLINPETVCQFTGLYDKNNNRIWENDIVKKVDTNALGYHRERFCIVSFDKFGYWKITTTLGDAYFIGEFDNEQLEVIGNIFDNPELVQSI